MTKQDIITLYQAMSAITGEMLAAAQAEDWELLATLESRCSAHVQKAKDAAPIPDLNSLEREQQANIIQKILADDREIRKLTEPWVAHLSSLLNSTNTERKLSLTYGA